MSSTVADSHNGSQNATKSYNPPSENRSDTAAVETFTSGPSPVDVPVALKTPPTPLTPRNTPPTSSSEWHVPAVVQGTPGGSDIVFSGDAGVRSLSPEAPCGVSSVVFYAVSESDLSHLLPDAVKQAMHQYTHYPRQMPPDSPTYVPGTRPLSQVFLRASELGDSRIAQPVLEVERLPVEVHLRDY